MSINPTTELSAVNIMLETISASPITSLTDVRNQDTIVAQSILDQIVKELQSEEWHFNTEENYLFTPDVDGKIAVPTSITRIHPDPGLGNPEDVTVRGSYLYDRANHTFIFPRKFTATVVLCLPFEDVPAEAKLYITVRAARKFAAVTLGDDSLVTWTQQDEVRLRAAFAAADLRQASLALGCTYKLDPVIGVEMARR